MIIHVMQELRWFVCQEAPKILAQEKLAYRTRSVLSSIHTQIENQYQRCRKPSA